MSQIGPYHILNGDALKEMFPTDIPGHRIVMRECLVDGPVSATDPNDFYAARAEFLSLTYGGSTEEYYSNVVPEFDRMTRLPARSEICLWFEDDLFCQVNLWFVIHLIHLSATGVDIHLVRPGTHDRYGFGGFDDRKLEALYDNRVRLEAMKEMSMLWVHYQKSDLEALSRSAQELSDALPFLKEAVEAHIQRLPQENDPGRPTRAIRQIIEDLGTDEFGPVFQEFCQREPIYGFGDLQVRRLISDL